MQALRALLAAGATTAGVTAPWDSHWPPLHYAAHLNSLACACVLVAQGGLDPLALDADGRTVLAAFVRGATLQFPTYKELRPNWASALRGFRELGCDLLQRSARGETVLMAAAGLPGECCVGLLEQLLEALPHEEGAQVGCHSLAAVLGGVQGSSSGEGCARVTTRKLQLRRGRDCSAAFCTPRNPRLDCGFDGDFSACSMIL